MKEAIKQIEVVLNSINVVVTLLAKEDDRLWRRVARLKKRIEKLEQARQTDTQGPRHSAQGSAVCLLINKPNLKVSIYAKAGQL